MSVCTAHPDPRVVGDAASQSEASPALRVERCAPREHEAPPHLLPRLYSGSQAASRGWARSPWHRCLQPLQNCAGIVQKGGACRALHAPTLANRRLHAHARPATLSTIKPCCEGKGTSVQHSVRKHRHMARHPLSAPLALTGCFYCAAAQTPAPTGPSRCIPRAGPAWRGPSSS